MKEYLMLFRGGLNLAAATPDEIQQAMARWKEWMSQLAAQNKLVASDRLAREGIVLTGTKKALRDGPYAEGKEVVGGYLQFRAADLDEALEISKGCPIFYYDGSLELREVIPN